MRIRGLRQPVYKVSILLATLGCLFALYCLATLSRHAGLPFGAALDSKALVCSVVLAVAVPLLCTPFAMGYALYVFDFASRDIAQALNRILRHISAIPAIFYGCLVAYFSTYLALPLYGWALIAVTLACLPRLCILFEGALRRIPVAYRLACCSMGARRYQAIFVLIRSCAAGSMLASILDTALYAVNDAVIFLLVMGMSQKGVTIALNTLRSAMWGDLGAAASGALVLLLLGVVLSYGARRMAVEGA